MSQHFQHPVPYGAPKLLANPVGSAIGAGVAAGIGAGLGALAAWAMGRDVRQWAYYGAAGGAGLSLVSNAFAQEVPRVSMDTYPTPSRAVTQPDGRTVFVYNVPASGKVIADVASRPLVGRMAHLRQ